MVVSFGWLVPCIWMPCLLQEEGSRPEAQAQGGTVCFVGYEEVKLPRWFF